MNGQLGRWADRAGLEVPTTVGADAVEDLVDTARAERALEGADAGVGALRRQVDVAALAGRTQLQHRVSLERRVGAKRQGNHAESAQTGSEITPSRRTEAAKSRRVVICRLGEAVSPSGMRGLGNATRVVVVSADSLHAKYATARTYQRTAASASTASRGSVATRVAMCERAFS